MAVPTKPRFRRISIRELVDRVDPGARFDRPIVYYFSGGRTKREPRVPGPYRTD